jgi:NADH-quinone oxidoreductase subunit J
MNELLPILGAAIVLLALGLWLMLPRGGMPGRALGTLLAAVSLGLVASQIPRLGSWAASGVFYVLAGVTVLAAVATVTFRNPVYSAIWFGLSLLGTAGLFLFQGAQFLGVATVVVYAGAILVTFLFVLMLAQPQGQAFYDRVSWSPGLSAMTGALVVAILTLTITGVFQNPVVENRPQAALPMAVLQNDILADQHMAHLGAQLYSRYLVAVEVAGTLLLVALVGTVAIVVQVKRSEAGGGQSHD